MENILQLPPNLYFINLIEYEINYKSNFYKERIPLSDDEYRQAREYKILTKYCKELLRLIDRTYPFIQTYQELVTVLRYVFENSVYYEPYWIYSIPQSKLKERFKSIKLRNELKITSYFSSDFLVGS